MALAAHTLSAPETGSARVLIVDDSAVARAVMERIVGATDRFVVAASVSTATGALAFLAHNRVQFILLDVEMPGIDGITALPDLIAAGQGARVLIVSGQASEGATTTVQALALGAADTLFKPASGERLGGFGAALVDKLVRLADPAVPRASVATTVSRAPTVAPARPVVVGEEFDVVAIGASTGGIHALGQVLRALPAEMTAPILVTQHLPASFMPYFAAQLALLAGRPCDVGDDRVRIRPSRIIVAPGHAHLKVVRMTEGTAIRLSTQPVASGCMPSVDPMFESVAEVYGRGALGVVLSGMGRDGAQGAERIAGKGGRLVVQDRESSTVWGMPGSVAAAGCASAVLTPDAIGALIARGAA